MQSFKIHFKNGKAIKCAAPKKYVEEMIDGFTDPNNQFKGALIASGRRHFLSFSNYGIIINVEDISYIEIY